MYKLEKSYGKQAFDKWVKDKPRDLSGEQTSPDIANSNVWQVNSFRDLVEAVAFLGVMNKRLTLFYRGQCNDHTPLPAIFRPKWSSFFEEGTQFDITPQNRQQYFDALNVIGQKVFDICDGIGLPRWRGLRDIREVRWAIIQHYGLWPTPLLDLANNLRVAASFAMEFAHAKKSVPRMGYMYVVGMPHSTGSITFDIDEHIVLARLQSSCPPIAKRPHYQDGFLVGRFPLYVAGDQKNIEKSSLQRRLIAKVALTDDGTFWDDDFPPIGRNALCPHQDPLLDRFIQEFGPDGNNSVLRRARSFSA